MTAADRGDAVISQAAEFLAAKALHTVGIFREPASLTLVKQLWGRMAPAAADPGANADAADAADAAADADAGLREVEDPHLVAGLLLFVLRERAEPLFPFAQYDAALALADEAVDGAVPARPLKRFVAALPRASTAALAVVARLLARTAHLSAANEMTAASLAQVFAPVLCKPRGSAYMSLRHIQAQPRIRCVVQGLALHADEVFGGGGGNGDADAHSAGVRPADLHVIGRLLKECSGLLWSSGDAPASSVSGEREGEEPAPQQAEPPAAADDDDAGATAVRRRKMVQSCRRLRVELNEFEAEFAAHHGHSPTVQERGDMAPAYARYRALKRSIREEAATQIQAVARGRLARAGWSPSSGGGGGAGGGAGAGAEPEAEPEPEERLSEVVQVHDEGDAPDDPLAALVAEKRQIKAQLKQFDADYKREHGRMPTKADKEPIRHLYSMYNDVKEQIARINSAPPGDAAAAASADAAGAAALRREKRELQARLKEYERKFLLANGRKVKYHADITPVLSDYLRYKEVKQVLRVV